MINLSWESFKSVCSQKSIGMQYIDVDDKYYIWSFDGPFHVTCQVNKDSGADHTDFEDNYKEASNRPVKSDVQTQFERTDIVLKTSKAQASFTSGEAEISIKVPGTPGSGDGRYVAGGYAITDAFTFGDNITQINIVDVDDILGMGAHTVIQTYHDADVDAANQGWFLWPSHAVGGVASGEIEIDPMGYYGFIPSGLYLEIYFEASSSTNVYCDIWWGQSVE